MNVSGMSVCANCGHTGFKHDYGGNCRNTGCSCTGYKFLPAPAQHDHGLICRPEESLQCSLCGQTYFICRVCHADVYGHHQKCSGRVAQVASEVTDKGTHDWEAIGREPWLCKKCGATEPRENASPEMVGCPATNENEHQIIKELRAFLPEWGYPSHVIAAICLEIKARIGGTL